MFDSSSLTDLAEIRALVDDYAIAMDRTDVEAFARLFVPDGALIVRGLGRPQPLGIFRGPGPKGIGLVALMMDELYQATLHHITTHRVDLGGDTATGTTYCLAYHIVDGLPEAGGRGLETLGVKYDDAFVRTADGWRFKERDATRVWSQVTATPVEPLLVDRAAGTAKRAS